MAAPKSLYPRKMFGASLLPSQLQFLDNIGIDGELVDNRVSALDSLLLAMADILRIYRMEGSDDQDLANVASVACRGMATSDVGSQELCELYQQLKIEMEACPRQPHKKPKTPRVSAAVKATPEFQRKTIITSTRKSCDGSMQWLTSFLSNNDPLLTAEDRINNYKWICNTGAVSALTTEDFEAAMESRTEFFSPKVLKLIADGECPPTYKDFYESVTCRSYARTYRNRVKSHGEDNQFTLDALQEYGDERVLRLSSVFNREHVYAWLFCLAYREKLRITDWEASMAYLKSIQERDAEQAKELAAKKRRSEAQKHETGADDVNYLDTTP